MKRKSLIKKLIELTEDESPRRGNWRVTLDYDNYHDGARVLDGDGKVIAECYDSPPNLQPPESAEWQFLKAIQRAVKAKAKSNE